MKQRKATLKKHFSQKCNDKKSARLEGVYCNFDDINQRGEAWDTVHYKCGIERNIKYLFSLINNKSTRSK